MAYPRRSEKTLIEAATAHGVALLCYGALAGGFLSDRWLGAAAPDGPLENRSLVKYRLIIEEFGGWGLFQTMLAALRAIADRHGCDIATVASAAVLGKQGVAAVIVGARDCTHLEANSRIATLKLSAEDIAEIQGVSTNTVRARIQRARKKLVEWLKSTRRRQAP